MKVIYYDTPLGIWLGTILLTSASAFCSDLHVMPKTQLKTRWYTYENRYGEKGGGGKAKFGRKGAPATWIRPAQPVDPNTPWLR
ncbi:MAG TPA: hypothetical protein ENI81_05485, partial [Phycisphaerales bacterium]|nr:hypothetical protein [Phycisphaerales bacterium]